MAQSGDSVEPLVGIPFETTFEVTAVTLIDSHWSTFPPRYTAVGDFTVGGAL